MIAFLSNQIKSSHVRVKLTKNKEYSKRRYIYIVHLLYLWKALWSRSIITVQELRLSTSCLEETLFQFFRWEISINTCEVLRESYRVQGSLCTRTSKYVQETSGLSWLVNGDRNRRAHRWNDIPPCVAPGVSLIIHPASPDLGEPLGGPPLSGNAWWMRRGASRTARHDTGRDRTIGRDGTRRDGERDGERDGAGHVHAYIRTYIHTYTRTRARGIPGARCGVKCLTLTGRNHRAADADLHELTSPCQIPRWHKETSRYARVSLGSIYVIIF